MDIHRVLLLLLLVVVELDIRTTTSHHSQNANVTSQIQDTHALSAMG